MKISIDVSVKMESSELYSALNDAIVLFNTSTWNSSLSFHSKKTILTVDNISIPIYTDDTIETLISRLESSKND